MNKLSPFIAVFGMSATLRESERENEERCGHIFSGKRKSVSQTADILGKRAQYCDKKAKRGIVVVALCVCPSAERFVKVMDTGGQ